MLFRFLHEMEFLVLKSVQLQKDYWTSMEPK